MQHREWNPKSFFRNLPEDVIASYEARRGIDLVRDPTKPLHDRAYYAFMALPEGIRLSLQSELLIVNDMCTLHARFYLETLGRLVWRGNQVRIDGMRECSVNELAMRLYLDDTARFVEVHLAYALDMMEHFAEFRGQRMVELRPTTIAKDRMKREMSDFAKAHAGGGQCQVEDFEGDNKFGLFIYREEELMPVEQFQSGIVVPIWQRSVVRIAAMFYPDTSTLMVKAPRKEERETLRDLFAAIFINDIHYFDNVAAALYNFNPLRNPRFTFVTHPADRIDRVSVVRLTARSAHANAKRSRIELVSSLSMFEVHEVMAAHGIDLADDPIEEAFLQFQFEGKGRSRFRTASIRPGGTNLCDVPRDRLIRRYLREWTFDERKSAFAMAVTAGGSSPVI